MLALFNHHRVLIATRCQVLDAIPDQVPDLYLLFSSALIRAVILYVES